MSCPYACHKIQKCTQNLAWPSIAELFLRSMERRIRQSVAPFARSSAQLPRPRPARAAGASGGFEVRGHATHPPRHRALPDHPSLLLFRLCRTEVSSMLAAADEHGQTGRRAGLQAAFHRFCGEAVGPRRPGGLRRSARRPGFIVLSGACVASRRLKERRLLMGRQAHVPDPGSLPGR